MSALPRLLAGGLSVVALVAAATLAASPADASALTGPLRDSPSAVATPVGSAAPSPQDTPAASEPPQTTPEPTASQPTSAPEVTETGPAASLTPPDTARPVSPSGGGTAETSGTPTPSPSTRSPTAPAVPPPRCRQPSSPPCPSQPAYSRSVRSRSPPCCCGCFGGPRRRLLRGGCRVGGGGLPAGTTALLVDLGEAMIDAGFAVNEVQDTLRRALAANGSPGGEVIVFPTALFVSVPGQAAVETEVAAAGVDALRLDQVDAVSRLATAAEAGRLTPAQGRSALRQIRDLPPAFGPTARVLGYAGFSVGLALILRGSTADLVAAAVLGALVGGILLRAGNASATLRAVLPLGCAALVSTIVLALGRTGFDVGVFAPIVAPLVMFLPGALLTTSVIELATGQLIGAGGVAGGLMQLLLLALGIVAGAELVGIPAITVTAVAAHPLGDLAPWLGVAVFGVGVAVFQCAPRQSFGWILLVLYVAYGAQIIGGVFLGPLLSGFVGALVMTPVAGYVARRDTGPATQVSFLPAFWLLVPGALGLVGVTKLLGDDRADALPALATTATTMIAISFGVLIGRALVGALPRGGRALLRGRS